jgi:hypothetical protein
MAKNENNAVMTGPVQLTDEETDQVTGGVVMLNPNEHPVGGPCNARLANNGYEHSDGRGARFECVPA